MRGPPSGPFYSFFCIALFFVLHFFCAAVFFALQFFLRCNFFLRFLVSWAFCGKGWGGLMQVGVGCRPMFEDRWAAAALQFLSRCSFVVALPFFLRCSFFCVAVFFGVAVFCTAVLFALQFLFYGERQVVKRSKIS